MNEKDVIHNQGDCTKSKNISRLGEEREKEEEDEEEDVLLSMQAMAKSRDPKMTLDDKIRAANREQGGGIGRGESYDNFSSSATTEMTKLPSLNPPVPPEGGGEGQDLLQ